MSDSGQRRALVLLSGGLDSAVVCTLAAKALGPENVTAVMMPTSISDPASRADAGLVVSTGDLDQCG